MVPRLKTRFATEFFARNRPHFEGRPRRLTAKQVLAELADLKRGGTWVGVEAIDADGRTLTLDEIEELADSGPGRPVSTGSAATPLVQFRVGTAERADLERRAKALGETVGEYARRKTLARD